MLQRIIQAAFLVGFVFLLFFGAETGALGLPASLFLRLSPLVAIGTMVSARLLIASMAVAALVVLAALVFGRFFCAYVCPLGTTIDGLEWLTFRRRKRREAHASGRLRPIKYYLLALLIVSALFGLNLVYVFDPIALATRAYTFLAYPLAILAANTFLDVLRPLAMRLDWVGLSFTRFSQPVYMANLVTLLILAGIVALGAIQPRFWCRNLCPMGALLSLVSRWGVFRRTVASGCTNCLQCIRHCPMDAIPEDPHKTRIRECTQCRTCVRVCPERVVSFNVVSPFKSAAPVHVGVGLSRRTLLLAVAGGSAASFAAYGHPARIMRNPDVIRPPGALPEQDFLDTCVRCGNCMRTCITNTLQPCTVQYGLRNTWSPRLVQRLSPCEATCNLCGQVCPTQAIRNLALEEKVVAKIGTAYIDRRRCLAWEHDRLCLICDEQCPYDAIELTDVEGLKSPVVHEHKCAGCGMCESKCPVEGKAAIVVLPTGEIRLKAGSYLQEVERRNLEIRLVDKPIVPQTENTLDLSIEDLGLDPENLPPLPPGFITDEEIDKIKEQ